MFVRLSEIISSHPIKPVNSLLRVHELSQIHTRRFQAHSMSCHFLIDHFFLIIDNQ